MSGKMQTSVFEVVEYAYKKLDKESVGGYVESVFKEQYG